MGDTDKHRAVRGAFWSLLDVASGQVLSFLIFMVMTRLVTPEQFGVYSMANIFVSSTYVFFGFGEALIRGGGSDDGQASTAFWMTMGLAAIYAGGLFLLAPWMSLIFGSGDFTPVLRAMCLVPLLMAMVSVNFALFRKQLDIRTFVLRTAIGYVAGGCVGVWVALHGWGVWALVAALVVQWLAVTVFVWTVSPWRPRLTFSPDAYRKMRAFAAGHIFSTAISVTASKIDLIVIGAILDGQSLGYYALALRILQIMGNVIYAPISMVALPFLSRAKNMNEFNDAYDDMVIGAHAIMFPLMAGLGMFAPQALSLFGDHWNGAADVLRAVCLCAPFFALTSLTPSALAALNRTDVSARLSLVQCVVTVAALTAASHFGIVVLGVAWSLIFAGLVPLHFLALYRLTGSRHQRIFWASAKISGATILMLLVLAVFKLLAVGLLLSVLAGAAVYLAAIEAIAMPGYLSSVLRTVTASYRSAV